jgi:hypothetical protein
MQDGYSAINEIVMQSAAKKEDQPAQGSTENSTEKVEAQPAQQGAVEEKKDPPPAGAAEEKKDPPAAGANSDSGSLEKPDPIAELLKEHNLGSIDELKEFLTEKSKKPADPETPEQIKKREDLYQANLVAFGVEKGIIKLEDVTKLETLKAKSDKDLVFESFAAEVRDEVEEKVKKENPLATADEIQEKIKEAFNEAYPVDSDNQKAKARAERKLLKEAKEIRQPLESSLTKVKADYDEHLSIQKEFPLYSKSITKMVTEAIPKNVSFFTTKDGDEDVPVVIEVSEADQKEILASLSAAMEGVETFSLYKSGKSEEIKKMIQDRTEYHLWKKYGDVGKQKIAETFLSRGRKQGSTVGAENSFETNQAQNKGGSTKQTQASAEAQVIESTRKK